MADIADVAAAIQRTEFAGEIAYKFGSRIEETGIVKTELFRIEYNQLVVVKVREYTERRTHYCVAATLSEADLLALALNVRFLMYGGAAIAFGLSALLDLSRNTRWFLCAVFACTAAIFKYYELHP
jgi:hypothetical protein